MKLTVQYYYPYHSKNNLKDCVYPPDRAPDMSNTNWFKVRKVQKALRSKRQMKKVKVQRKKKDMNKNHTQMRQCLQQKRMGQEVATHQSNPSRGMIQRVVRQQCGLSQGAEHAEIVKAVFT